MPEDSRGVASPSSEPYVVARQQASASTSSTSSSSSPSRAAATKRPRPRPRHPSISDLSGERSPISSPYAGAQDSEDEDADSSIGCLICLASPSSTEDRAILPICLHSLFCFGCILKWTDLKRTCPLCNAQIGPYILHQVHSEVDYQRFYLRPRDAASNDDGPSSSLIDGQVARQSMAAERIRRQRRLLRQRQAREERRANERSSSAAILAEQSRSLALRKYIYRRRLYALHIGSNRFTGFQSTPTPKDLAQSPHLVSQLLAFLRREIQALPLGPAVDVPFLSTYVTEVFKSLDVRSEGSVRLLGDLFGDEALAEHFCHEVTTWLRSGARTCAEFDRKVRYAVEEREEARATAAAAAAAAAAEASSSSSTPGIPPAKADGDNKRLRSIASTPSSAEASHSQDDDVAAKRRRLLLARLAHEKEELAARAR